MCLILIPSFSLGQEQYLTVRDEVDLQAVESVRVSLIGNGEDLILSGETDGAGRFYFLTGDLAKTKRIELIHENYKKQTFDAKELADMGFQVFLQVVSYNFNEVVFTANKYKEKANDIPHSISVIKPQEVQLRNPQTSADLLQQTGKVFVQKSQMGGGSPNIRGFEANKVLIVVDGVRMNNAIYRSGHLQNVITIDPTILGRTEVMYGPGSVMYGSDALGGVMHFYTRQPVLSSGAKPLISGNTSMRFASANEEKSLHADVSLGFKKWGFLTSITATDYGDLRAGNWRTAAYENFGERSFYIDQINGVDSVIANEDVNLQRPTAYSQMDFMQKVYFLPSPKLSHTLNLQLSTSTDVPRYDRLTQIQNGGLRYAEWNYGPQNRLLASHQMKIFSKIGAFDQLILTTAYQNIEESRKSRTFRSNIRDNRIEKLNIFSLNADASKVVREKHEMAYGMEAVINLVDSDAFAENMLTANRENLDTRYPDGGTQTRSFAAYFTHRWEINEEMTFTNGLRLTDLSLDSRFEDKEFFPFEFDRIENHWSALSGNLGLVLQPSGGWRIALLGSTGFRAPNLDDIGKVFDSQPGNVVVPNPNVKPEYTYNGELTVSKRMMDHLFIEATGFYTYYAQAIVLRDFMLSGQDSIMYSGVLSKVTANVNARNAFVAGFNVNVKYALEHFSFQHTMTYTYGREFASGLPMDHIPPFFGKTSIKYQAKKIQGEFSSFYNGWKRLEEFSPRDLGDLDFATSEGWPSWWILNFKTSYAINPKLRVQFGIENILDRHYRPYSSRISGPGRNFILSLRSSF